MDSSPQKKAKRLAAIPTILLLVIACVQIYLAKTADLTPWKGGGFGMFSTTDGNMFRTVRVFVSAPDRSEELLLAGTLQELAVDVQMFPSERLSRKLAQAILRNQHKKGLSAEKVEIDVWRLDFDSATLEPRGTILRRFSYSDGAQ